MKTDSVAVAAVAAVLIETYWNVNIAQHQERQRTEAVLIETYWNVNCVDGETYNIWGIVLIETYWNVNQLPFPVCQ